MTQRTWAAVAAVPLFVGLVGYVIFSPLHFVVYGPGPTLNVLGQASGRPIISVQGHRAYPDPGQLRLTTVSVTVPKARLDLFTLMSRWLNSDDAVLPYSAVYTPHETNQQSGAQSADQMTTSQDSATAVALHELGYRFPSYLQVTSVTPQAPADGKLKSRDRLLRIGEQQITPKSDVAAMVSSAKGPLTFVVRRAGKRVRVQVTPQTVGGAQRVGIALSVGYTFPFRVSVDLGENIGGPSAGLMFSLGIYDTLTPGSLTGQHVVAGTGEIFGDGAVGPIGGIQQKIAGARADGAQLFLVPPKNCTEALAAHPGPMRLAVAPTMHDAVKTIETFAKNSAATLPACTKASG